MVDTYPTWKVGDRVIRDHITPLEGTVTAVYDDDCCGLCPQGHELYEVTWDTEHGTPLRSPFASSGYLGHGLRAAPATQEA